MNAPAQFQRILRRSETIVKLRMDEILRFWVDVAVEHIKSDHANIAPSVSCLPKSCEQYERRGDAMRYLNENGKIAWKASPRFLTMLADAERDARDDLADWP